MNDFVNSYRAGLLERWGKSVLFSLGLKRKVLNLADESFKHRSRFLIWRGTLYSFLIGFIPSFLFVWISFYLSKPTDFSHMDTYFQIVYILLLILLFTFIEFYLLFRVGLYEAFLMAESANLELAEEPELITPVPGMLARIALEIPDPELRLFGIDPYRRSNRKTILFMTVLYKTKVFLSNLATKVVLKAILGRSSLRLYVEYVSAPITGFWDGYVTYKILRELRMRIISRKIAEKIILIVREKKEMFSENGKEAILRAIGNSIVFTKTFHPNFEFLLLKLVKELEITLRFPDLDDDEIFINCLRKCTPFEANFAFRVFLIGSCFDGKITKEENHFIRKLFPDFSASDGREAESLSKLIGDGFLIESIHLVEKMMN